MKYICIDIETTGLDPETCQIIEFAAVIRDTKTDEKLNESPSFHCYVKHKMYQGGAYAIALNARVFEQLSSKKPDAPIYTRDKLCDEFYEWLKLNEFETSKTNCKIHFVAAGKNFGNFDLQFLKKLPKWNACFNVSARILDPAMLWIRPEDNRVPGLKTCMDRAGIEGEVTHHALQDVYDTIMTIELGLKNLWK